MAGLPFKPPPDVAGGVPPGSPMDIAAAFALCMASMPWNPYGRGLPMPVMPALWDARERAARRSQQYLGTNDLLMSDVLRPNEKQVWFLSEHLVNAPGDSEVTERVMI